MDRITAIRVFVAVADSGSFTRAAQQLAISRPMISRHIALLEQWFDARLLQRNTRHVTLTNAGERALQQCRNILALVDDIEHEQQHQKGELQGTLRLTASISFGSVHLAPALTEFLARHPQLRIQLELSEESLNLVESRIDLAIRISSSVSPSLIARPLAPCHSVLVASPGYLQQHGAPEHPDELRRHRCVRHSRVVGTEWTLIRQGKRHRVAIDCPLQVNDAFAMLQATLAGGGIARLPRYLLEPGGYLANGQLQQVLPDWSVPPLVIHAVYASRQHQPPAVRALLDFLVERFGDRDW